MNNYSQSPCYGQIYTVQPGDTMYLIAQKFGVPLNVLITANPQIIDPNVIYPGEKICIPSSYPPRCNGKLYLVMAGDTLYLIAQRYNVPLKALIAANPQIANPDLIYPGMVICIPRRHRGGSMLSKMLRGY